MAELVNYRPEDHTFAVCAFKDNPYLAETIETIQSQTVLGNVLVSTSTPSDYIAGVCKKYQIPLIVNPNPHFAGDDWNFAYNSSNTPLVTIVHQDDRYCPNYLETVLETLNVYGNDVLLAFSDYYEIRTEGDIDNNALLKIKRFLNTPLRFRIFNGSRFVKRRLLAFGDAICCPSVVLVKEILGDSVFDTSYKNSCDYKTWVDLASVQGRFVYIPEQLMGHRIYADSATSKNLSEGIRRCEDYEILATLWPSFIAKVINSLYANSEKSNQE